MIILGKYGDTFAQNLYEQMRMHKEGISYYPYNYRLFANDELLPRYCDPPYLAITGKGSRDTDADIRFPPGSDKIRSAIKNDPNVVLVVRGASGYKWKPVHETFNAYIASKHLKNQKYGMGAEYLVLVLPHMPFGKQDHLFYDNDGKLIDGAPMTLKDAREFLKQYADRLISFNPHDFRDRTGWIVKNEKTIPGATRDEGGRILDTEGRIILPEAEDWTGFAYSIDAIPTIVKHIISSVKNPLFIGPDKSVENAIRKFSENPLIADKKRDKYDSSNVQSKITLPDEMRGCDAVLIDDLIQEGNTMNNVVRELIAHKNPPKSVTCGAVNGEFVYNRKLEKSAYDVLTESGAKIVVTDTIETPVSKVSVVPLLAKELYKLTK